MKKAAAAVFLLAAAVLIIDSALTGGEYCPYCGKKLGD